MSLFGYGFGFSSRAVPAASAGALPGFDFASVGTIEMWLDARDTPSITESGGVVSAWNNRIPAKALTSVSQSTPADRPTLASGALNGLDAIRFGGLTTDTSLVAPADAFSGGPVYIYTLLERTSSPGTTNGVISIYNSGTPSIAWNLDLNSTYNGVFGSKGITATTTNTVSTGVQAHILWGRQKVGGAAVEAGIDGGSVTTALTPIFPNVDRTIIGNVPSLGAAFQGDISIVLVYSILSPAEHIAVIGGLAAIGAVP